MAIPTVTNNIVESDRVLTVSLGLELGLRSREAEQRVGDHHVVGPADAQHLVQHVHRGPGGAATFTITADQAPVKDTSVNFSVQGTAVPGQNYVPLVGTALLKAGQTQVTVVLQSLENNVVFDPTDMIVGQWPIRVGQVFVKAGAPVAPGEAMLSLTESDLTVTLQASAADRSKLAVGQSCTVQIAGETNQGTGPITELDSTPTVISSGAGGQSQQVYEGRIEVVGPHRRRRIAGVDQRGRSASERCVDRPHRRREAEWIGRRRRPGDRPRHVRERSPKSR